MWSFTNILMLAAGVLSMITVHHLSLSRSQRIIWLLEELELPYEVVTYQRHPQTMLAPPELRKVHPLGKSPVITDGENVVAESGAIITYLLDRYDIKGLLRPSLDSKDRIDYEFWLHYAEGSLMPILLVGLVFARLEKAPVPFFIKPIVTSLVNKVKSNYLKNQYALNFSFIENSLKDRAFFGKQQLSAADIQMSYPLEAGIGRAGLGSQYPQISKLLERYRSRPAYQRAEKRVNGFGVPA